jgi:hypothetical protein
MSWVSELAPPGARGLAMSLRVATNRLTQTVLPAGLGVVAIAGGAAVVFFATGGAVLIAAWLGAAIGDGREPKPSR